MLTVKQLLAFLLSLTTFVYTFYVVGKLVLFLSLPNSIPKYYTWVFNLLDNKSRLETAYGVVVFDMLYLIGFIFQHSFMKSQVVKNLFQKIGLATIERAIYSLTSALCLHYLINHWLPAKSIVLWSVDVENSKVLWWTFVLTHSIAWITVYGGSLIMDLPELLGIKQTYYDLKGYAPPSAYKSEQLKRLYSHQRHPSFTGLSIILWVTNLMTIDRLLLSVLLTAYMYFAWSTDRNDVVYQKYQLRRKMQELKSN